jgi:DNA-binding protein HU-beta
MYKTALVRQVSHDTRYNHEIVGSVIDATVKAISRALNEGKSVTLLDFGTFTTKQQAQRHVRDFRTGERVMHPAKRVATFRVSDRLKRAVAKGKR